MPLLSAVKTREREVLELVEVTKRVCKTPTGAEAMGFMGREALDVTEIGGLTTAVRHETMLECHREHEKELDGEHALYLRERDEKRKLEKEKLNLKRIWRRPPKRQRSTGI